MHSLFRRRPRLYYCNILFTLLFILLAVSVDSLFALGPRFKYGVVGARGVVLQDAGQGVKQPVWVEYNEKGEMVGKIDVDAAAMAHAVAISRTAYLAYAAGDENWIPDTSVSLNENISSVLFNNATREVIFASENNIGPWAAFYVEEGADPMADSHRQRTLSGYDLEDTLTNPVAGAMVEAPGSGMSITDDTGFYSVPIYTYPSCFPYSEMHTLFAKMRFNKFDPDNPSGHYYLSRDTVVTGGGDISVCSAMMGATLAGQMAAIGIANSAQMGAVMQMVNFAVDVTMLSGKGVMSNTVPAFGVEVPLDDTIPPAVTLADATVYQAVKNATRYIPPEEPLDKNNDGIPDYFKFDESTGVVKIWVDGQNTGDPDMTLQAELEPLPLAHSGLVASISQEDLQNTDIYVFRVSNDQLMAARDGLNPSESNPYYGGGALKDESGVYYKMLMRGPASFHSPGTRNEDIQKWLKAMKASDMPPGTLYDNIRPGEAIKVFLVNRATGYMGSAITSFGSPDSASTPMNFDPKTIIMSPPNIRINVERHHEIKTGITAGEPKENIIGFEGSGLTSDNYIKVTTEWTDADGSPLPPGLEGFTGRLAKVVDENTLQSTGSLANFEIKPGKHTEMIKLPQGSIDKAHYYIHISGEKILDNPDFSSLGGEAAGELLEYRPRHFVPFMVPLYDKENSPSIHEPQHQWVFRPEMQFSLFELEKMEYEYENQETGKTEIIDLLEDTAGADLPVLSDLDLVYKLLSDENNALSEFGPDRELVLGVGDQQILVSLNENDTPVFQYLNNVEIKPEDYLALRLYQNGDEANVLWEYAICNVQFVPDYNRDGQIDMTDRNLISSQPKWRFWINDDNDKSASKDGIGGSGVDMPGQNKDNADLKVSGIRDLVDFFPLYFDLKAALNMLPASDYTYRLSQKETALGMVRNTGLKYNAASEDDMSGAYLTKMSVAEKFKEINSFQIGNTGSVFQPAYTLQNEDLEKIKNDESNVLLFEGKKLTQEPLVLDIIKKSNKEIIITYEFPLEICGVNEMFAHENFRDIGGGSGGREDFAPSQTKKPPCMVDNENTLVFIHGYHVDGDAATATFAEVFKRLFHAGYNGNFYGVSWYGDPSGSIPFMDSHYHQAVVSAFNFAKPFADFVNGLPAKKKTVAAHSLGNMVTGVAIQDYGLKADNYFAIDAAVVLEAYGLIESKDTMHAGNGWNDYIEYDASLNKLFSSEWHTLFDENDNRKKLTWRNRLDKVVTTNVYNFFSSTEDVLREYPGDNLIFDDAGLNLGVYAFVKQEKYKGRKQLVNIGGASSPYAGWGYNFDLNTGSGWSKLLMTGPMKTYRKYTPIEAKEEIIDVNNGEILKTKPFFKANPPELFDPNTGSDFVTKKVKDVPDLKNYYTKLEAEEVSVRDWLLAEAFPALTLPMGANKNIDFGEIGNLDMSSDKVMTNTDTWPKKRINSNDEYEWWHSDFKDLSYHYSYKFYKKILEKIE